MYAFIGGTGWQYCLNQNCPYVIWYYYFGVSLLEWYSAIGKGECTVNYTFSQVSEQPLYGGVQGIWIRNMVQKYSRTQETKQNSRQKMSDLKNREEKNKNARYPPAVKENRLNKIPPQKDQKLQSFHSAQQSNGCSLYWEMLHMYYKQTISL